MSQLMPRPLTVSCSSKTQIGFTFLVPAHLGSPGKRAVKWVCVCGCVYNSGVLPTVCDVSVCVIGMVPRRWSLVQAELLPAEVMRSRAARIVSETQKPLLKSSAADLCCRHSSHRLWCPSFFLYSIFFRYRDSVVNTVEENSSVLSLIQMHWLLPACACGQ